MHAYVVDMPLSAWTTGTHAFDANPGGNLGAFYYRLSLNTGAADAVAIATSGSFSVQVSGLAAGQSVSFTDAGGHAYRDATGNAPGAVLATGGAGSFSGTWTDPAGTQGTAGGSVTVAFLGSSLVLNGADARCYDINAMAPIAVRAASSTR